MNPQHQLAVRNPRRAPPPAVFALKSSIASLFGQDVLPRLARPREEGHGAQIATLARAAASGDAAGLSGAISQLLDQGLRAEHICQVYLTDIAAKLGDFWMEDRCSFVEVTLGVILLQNELRRLAPRLPHQHKEGSGRSALMLAAPGEQHGFGLAMMAEFFRAAGWNVEELADSAEAPGRLAAEEFGLVAISVACASRALLLPPFIGALRSASRQPHLVVMVGGAALKAEPSLLPLLGADATAPDAASALQRAEALVSLMGAAG